MATRPDSINSSLLGEQFEGIQQDVLTEAQVMRAANPPEQPRFGVRQDYELYRIASRGVLEVLRGLGVDEADTLLARLDTDAAENWATDMYTVAFGLERDLWKEEPESFQERFETKRLALLAEAVGGTAHAAADIALGRSKAWYYGPRSVLARARGSVIGYEGIAGADVESNALHALLDEAEAAD